MLQLFESGFLLSLGKAIAASIWQMGVLFLVYHIIISALRIKQSAFKNLLSCIFALGGFLWFTITFLHFSFQKAGAAIVIEEGTGSSNLLQSIEGVSNWQIILSWMEYKLNLLLPYLSVAYLFVLIWFTAKLLFQIYATQQLKNQGTVVVNDELKEFTNILAASLGITNNIIVYISSRIDIPATIGFLKPVILLPASTVTHLTPAQLEAVLLHELAHIRRNDYFWNLLLSVTETLLFFNPFALLLINIARKERENSCDDVVMSYQQNAAVYAEALLNVEKARLHTPALAMALGDNKQHLMHRVKRILNLPAEKNKISTRLLALLFFTVVFALMGWVLQSKKQELLQLKEQPIAAEGEGLKEVLYFSPDKLVNTENKVELRDASKKINLKLGKNFKEEVFIIRNDEGEEFKFDKLVFEHLPKEWMPGFVPEEHRRWPIAPSVQEEQEMKLMYLRDSAMYMQQYLQHKELEEFYRRNLTEKRIRMKAPRVPMTFNFNNQPYMHADTLMKEFYETSPYARFEWNGDFPFVMTHELTKEQEKELSDKMKLVQKNVHQNFNIVRKRFTTTQSKKINAVDSLIENSIKLRSFPREWMTVMQPGKEDLGKEHPQLVIIIENNQITINGKQIQIDSSSVLAHPIPAASKKMLRLVEVMKL